MSRQSTRRKKPQKPRTPKKKLLGFAPKGGHSREIKIGGIPFKVSLWRETAVRKWGDWRWKYRLVVKRLDNGRQAQFAFYGSVAEYRGQAKRTDPLTAFRMILEDATYYINNNSWEDLMYELGYDQKEAKRVWKGVKNTYQKLRKLGLTDNDIFEGVNKIQRMGLL